MSPLEMFLVTGIFVSAVVFLVGLYLTLVTSPYTEPE